METNPKKWEIRTAANPVDFMATIFVGEHERTIDAKSRLSIPAEYRTSQGPDGGPLRFYLVPGARRGTVSLYLEEDFARHAQDLSSELLSDEDELTYMQMFYSQAALLDVDKQGRILIPERLLARHAIGREVLITGANDRLDLWNKADYEKFWEDNEPRKEELKRLARKAARDRRNQNA